MELQNRNDFDEITFDLHQRPRRETHVEYIPVNEEENNSDGAQSERRVTEIIHRIERDEALMQDNPKSELLRL